MSAVWSACGQRNAGRRASRAIRDLPVLRILQKKLVPQRLTRASGPSWLARPHERRKLDRLIAPDRPKEHSEGSRALRSVAAFSSSSAHRRSMTARFFASVSVSSSFLKWSTLAFAISSGIGHFASVRSACRPSYPP
jgi:hypothetical protein